MEAYNTLNIKIFISFLVLIYSSFAFAEEYKTEDIQSQLKLFYQEIQNNSGDFIDEKELFTESSLKNRLSYLKDYKSSKSPVLDYFKKHKSLITPNDEGDIYNKISFSRLLEFQRLSKNKKINNMNQVLIRMRILYPEGGAGSKYYIITFEGKNSKGLPLINPDFIIFCDNIKPGMISDFAYETKE